jgi:hypothetical protein
MRFAEGAKGLIFDLRYNNGGVLEMAQFLMSYLYPAGKEQKFFDYYYKENGVSVERSQWSLAAVPGQRSGTIPVVVLTGSTSFSAAEWMAFSLQRLGRATVIGERTAGGAHPVTRVPIDDRFMLQTPIGQIHDPVDGKDFEGVGVTPDLAVPASEAVLAAQKFLLRPVPRTWTTRPAPMRAGPSSARRTASPTTGAIISSSPWIRSARTCSLCRDRRITGSIWCGRMVLCAALSACGSLARWPLIVA